MKKKRCENCGWKHRKSNGRGKGKRGSTSGKWTGGRPDCKGFKIGGKKVN